MHFDERKIQHLQNQFDRQFIKLVYNAAKNSSSQPATVGKIVNGKYTTEYNKWCTANFVSYEQFTDQVDVLKNKCQEIIEEKYKVKCLDVEIHFLHYMSESEYKSHIDGQYIDEGIAKRGVDRDITCVLYLNDDYEGGNIRFDFFNKKLKPNTGDILIYPTTWQFTHAVEKVKGERYAIVFWYKTSPELNVESKIIDKNIQRFLQSITA